MNLSTRGVLLFFLAFLLLPIGAHAQNNSAGIKLIPAAIERGADPGEVFEERLTVTNVTGGTQTYYFVVRDISGVVNENQPIFAEEGIEETGFELSSWVVLPSEPITLESGQEATFPVVIEVPSDATPGSHFGGVFVTVEPPKLRTIGAGVGYEVGSIISIRISGDVVENASIRSFSTDKLIYSSQNVNFTTRVENSGNVLVRPRGAVEVTNMFGQNVGRVNVNESAGGVFPGTVRSFETLWEGDTLGFGRYQALVGLVYGEEGRLSSIDASISFWILPLNIILPVLGVLALIILILYIAIKLHIRRAIGQVRTRRGRRVVVRRRRDSGVSKLILVAISLLTAVVIFLIGLLILFA